MRKSLFILLTILVVFILSCANDVYSILATNNRIPDKVTVPIVKSFDKLDTIIIEWDKDVGADEYVLYRSAPNNPNGVYSVIYRGKSNRYEDYVGLVDTGTFYYYKLAKKREGVEFKKSKYVMGVVSRIVKDEWEENNESKRATDINDKFMIESNIYYAKDNYGNEIIDADWYSVEIPARIYYVYQVEFIETGINNDKIPDTGLKLDDETVYINNSSNFKVENRENGRKRGYFGLLINKSKFLENTSGFRIGIYKLKFVTSGNIDPQG